MYLAITDGTTTVVLSGTSPVTGCSYFPETASKRDGEWQPVTEDAEVNLRGTASAIRSTVNAIETLIAAAEDRRTTRQGPKIYVNYKPVDGDSTAYQSEILGGRVVWSKNPGLRRLGDTNPPAQIDVIWERAPGWDGALTEVSISAPSQGAGTGGKTLYNNPATGNWVQAAANQLTGVIPSPARVELTNNTGSSQNMEKMFLWVNAFSDPANFTYLYQGESRLSGGTVNSDGNASGGQVVSITTGTTTALHWSLSQADMQRTKGNRARVLLRADSLGALYIRPLILDSAGNATLWRGDEVTVSSLAYETLTDAGIVPLPPGGYNASYGAVRLGLEFRGGANVDLDYVVLATIDSYRYLALPGAALANTATFVHDGIEEQTYVSASGVVTPMPTAFGKPLLLYPGMINRVQALWERINSTTGNVPNSGTMSVRLYYRPRRLTV